VEAERVAGEIAARVQPEGYDVQDVSIRAREADSRVGWHSFVEVSLS
jgi:hypothetical protein